MGDLERPGVAQHEGSTGGIDALTEVLSEAVQALEKEAIDYVLIGGQASALLGRPRCSSDVDLLVTPEDAPRALEALDDLASAVLSGGSDASAPTVLCELAALLGIDLTRG